MTLLRGTPDNINATQTTVGQLTVCHEGLTVTLLGDDGAVVRGILAYRTLSNTPGHTSLGVSALGTIAQFTLPHSAPIHVHHQETA
jgi:hypothetical protein